MKRYRVLAVDIDSRAQTLKLEIQDNWEDSLKDSWLRAKRSTKEGLFAEYGAVRAFEKIDNFIAMDSSPVSIIAFHNKFLRQIRSAFIVGSYYASLTGACALGERILNQLILSLRDHYKSTPEYKKVYRKKSFDNWELAIDTLESWDVLVPPVVSAFGDLKKIRNKSIHFNPETDVNDRALALEAIAILQDLIAIQFSAFGRLPWYIDGTPGTCFVKKECETVPFVKEIIIPNCKKVGHLHSLEFDQAQQTWIVHDSFDYLDEEITDQRFAKMINNPSLFDSNNRKLVDNDA